MPACYGDELPVAALATACGASALALIRCSGTGAIEAAAKIFSSPEKLRKAAGNTVVHGWITLHTEKIDEVLVSVFRSPKSYTGEDSLDISCHGGGAVVRDILEALRAAGFRDALPGEFTFRAFMNGKLDLTRAESVMELVAANTGEGRRHAVRRLSGVLEQEINDIKQSLVQTLAAAELFLDYSEDEAGIEDEAAGRLPGREQAAAAIERLRTLAAGWRRERLYQEGILTVIAGRPNAGKSSLFNLLLHEERAIVTAVPGTTRDWIEGSIAIAGIPLRLADTAGLRETADPVEKIGVERSRELLEAAELILYVIDGAAGITDEDRAVIARLAPDGVEQRPLLLIWNKADLAPLPPLSKIAADVAGTAIISISAKTGEGMAAAAAAIDVLVGRITESAAEDSPETAAPGSLRQQRLIEAAAGSLTEALELADADAPLDLVAPLLREAVNALGEITGEVSTADILEAMFSRFCVGK
jgi:tRNA modification GTPase